MSTVPTNISAPFAVSAISGHLDTRTAATEVADRLFDEFGPEGGCDLALLFGSFHHRSAFSDAAEIIRRTIEPAALLAVTAESVLGEAQELEGLAGLAALAIRFPKHANIRVTPWHSTPDDPVPLSDPAAIRRRLGVDQSLRAVVMVGDPFSTPITRLLPAITGCGENGQTVPVIGGLASGASQPGLNVIVLNERVISGGAAGVTLSGDLAIDFIVSQGCRPIGKPLVVTKCHQNVVLELGGRKAIEVLQEIAQRLSDSEKRLLSKGLLIGTVINEYKPHFGRGDFLVRNILGMDQKVGGIAVGEIGRMGQTVQFHVRDAATATEDLQLLLDAQVMGGPPPFAALLFSCNGRGERLFGAPNHDLSIIRERLGEIPIAGFFAAGEFGPIGDRSFLHGHTASLALLRAGSSP